MSKFYDGVLIDSVNSISLEQDLQFLKRFTNDFMNKANNDVKEKQLA